jgi:hypothetical protein
MSKFQAEIRDTKDYFRPVSDGKIVRKITKEEYEQRVAVNPQDNVRAREWATPKDSGVAYEETYDAMSGRIVNIAIRDHEQYGRSIAVTLRQDNGAEGIFTARTDNQYGMSLMERLPSVDLEKEVRLSAYVKQNGENKRYTTFITQGETRIESFFKKWDDEKKEFVLSNGFPKVDAKEQKRYGDKFWSQRYFPECSIFLVEYIEKNIVPKVTTTEVVEDEDLTVVPEDGIF